VIPPLMLATVYLGLLAKTLRSSAPKFGWIFGAPLDVRGLVDSQRLTSRLQTAAFVRRGRIVLSGGVAQARSFPLVLSGYCSDRSSQFVRRVGCTRETQFAAHRSRSRRNCRRYLGFLCWLCGLLPQNIFVTLEGTVTAGLIVFGFVLGAWLAEKSRLSVSLSALLLLRLSDLSCFSSAYSHRLRRIVESSDRTLVIPAFILVVVLFVWFVLLVPGFGR
jgi:hypothetical protein